MRPRARAARSDDQRQALIESIGSYASRFQEASYAFDDVAAEVLALKHGDLPCMTMLLFGGPVSAPQLAAALHWPRTTVNDTLDRLQLAGYARLQPGGPRLELTEHARHWIERIWAPLRRDGERLLDRHPTAHLVAIAAFLGQACQAQAMRTRKLRSWLAVPPSPARRPHMRGGLSPAALRRVQVFVEANLDGALHLHDLAARAALSPYHFARAFKRSAGVTPRRFVENRRIDRARRLLAESTRPLADIAAECGLGTQSRLTTIFKRHTGLTPAAFRRARR